MARNLEVWVGERLGRVLGGSPPAPDDVPAPGLVTPAAALGRRAVGGNGSALSGTLHPGRPGLRALAAVAAVVVVVAAVLAWRSRPTPQPVAPPAPAEPTVQSGPETIVVSIAGRVRRPGLVRLPAGARVADAIEAAGGIVPGTDLSFVNLARKVADGELILIGVAPPAGVAAGGGPDASGRAPGGEGGRVNLNTATLAQLDTLPGIGPTLAQRIVEYRDQHGGFRSVAELRQDGIGDARFGELKDLVVV